ncbi:unnamed protein product [Tilletia controversa]|nr:unnamed protein product [Tilletia controversa]
MSSDTSGGTATPTPSKSEMDKLLEAIQASAEATRIMGTRFDGIERELAEVKTGRTMATEGATPASASPFTPQVLRPGIVPGHIARPGQTPALATPTARGVSGFLVPVTPKSNKESAEVHVGIGLTGLTFGSDDDFRHLDATLSAEERIESSRRASDETSDEVRQLKSQLWSTCLSIVQKENRSASPEEVIAKTDKMMSEHWLQIRKDRIMQMFDPSIRADVLKDSSKNAPGSGKKEWQRKISQSAPARIQNKLTHNNYIDWVSEVIGILAPIQGATEVLEGIEHGQGYLEDRPLEQTEGYDIRLDLEIGGLLSGSVSAECRGYIVARQAKGEHRGSILWRDLVGIMRRGDGVDKAIILEQVLVQRQRASENVRSYAERLRTLFIKSGAIDAAFSDGEQVLYLLRGLHSSMEPHRASIRAFQSQRHQYTFDSALLFLIQQEAASVLDQHPSRLPLLSRPAANLASSAGPGPRRFHILRNNAVKGTPGYFNGECRHCHKWGHKQEDCAQRKREIDAGTIAPTPVQAEANAARVEDNSGEEPSSDFEGEIYELIDEDGEVMFARLATSPVGESGGEANVARAMMAQIAVASHAATVEKTELAPATLEEFAAFHIPEKAVKWILDSGATHHMTSRSELLPFRIHSSANSVVHIADGTRAKIERRGACVASLFGDGGSEAVAVLKTVLVVPSFTNNLLSVQRLAEDGWTIQFSRTGAELTSPKGKKVQSFVEPGTGAPYLMLRSKPARWIDVKGVANRVGHVPVQATARLAAGEVEDGPGSQEEEALIQTDPQAKLWHRRLAHMSYFTLRILARDPAFAHVNRPGPKAFAEIIASEEPCDPCIESKQTLLPFGHSDSEAPAKMTDVCFDLTGQFERNKEYRYSLNILEAWSRMTWALPIPNKEASTVFAVFLAWVELMKNQGHGTIKRLHCDHGGEFENHLFQEWAGKNGIAWCFSAPNTSEQNGLIERWNRTIQDRARAMLRAARLSDSFWPYAFRSACEVINKSPSSGIGNLIPLTLWSSEPIDYDSMRVFGCLCWVVKPNKNRKNKLSVRAVRGTYLGPAPEHKAYLVYTPAERPFLRISRHVIFDESRLYDARFTLDQKQEHPGAASDIVELAVPRRTIKLSDVPFELDPAPVGTPMLEMLDEEDEAAWDTTIDNAISKEQQRGDSEDNWPSLDSVFGEEYDTEDLVTNDWTGELKRHRSPEHMGPSVYGVRNSYPELDDLGSPINLDDLDGAFQHTPTRAIIEPTVGAVLGEAPQHRRSKRLQGQFGALSASVEIAFKAVAGEELIRQSRDLAAQAFSAAIRSSADGVLIEPKSLAEAMSRDDWDNWA